MIASKVLMRFRIHIFPLHERADAMVPQLIRREDLAGPASESDAFLLWWRWRWSWRLRRDGEAENEKGARNGAKRPISGPKTPRLT